LDSENTIKKKSLKRKIDDINPTEEREIKKRKINLKEDEAKSNLKKRLPSGEIIKETCNENTLLEEIFEYLKTNYTELDDFCLISTYPRKKFLLNESKITLKEADLIQATLMVEKLTSNQKS